MTLDASLEGWAKASKAARYSEVAGGMGVCYSGDNFCAENFIGGIGVDPDVPGQRSQGLSKAITAIHQAWEDARNQIAQRVRDDPSLSGYELGIHMSEDGPRMMLLLVEEVHLVEQTA